MKIKANAKINLALDVTGKRDDGYHSVSMLMQEVSSDGCLRVLEEAGLRDEVLRSLLEALQRQLSRRAEGMRAGALMFSRTAGFLGLTEEAESLLREWRTGQ